MIAPDPLQQMIALFAGVGVVLVVASAIGLCSRPPSPRGQPHGGIDNLNARIKAWWVIVVVSGVAFLLGRAGVTLLFRSFRFVALREFMSVTCARHRDPPRVLASGCLIVLAMQYLLIYLGWYGAFATFVPVCAFLSAADRQRRAPAMRGSLRAMPYSTCERGLMTCVYCISHVPALLTLDIPGYEGRDLLLIVFLVLVVQSSDVLQYIWGKLCGRRKVAPAVSPSKTWEGLVGGVASATTLGAALYWITPFAPWQAALVALVITMAGFLGGLVLSAIKRDRGVKDWGRHHRGPRRHARSPRLGGLRRAGVLLPDALWVDLSGHAPPPSLERAMSAEGGISVCRGHTLRVERGTDSP